MADVEARKRHLADLREARARREAAEAAALNASNPVAVVAALESAAPGPTPAARSAMSIDEPLSMSASASPHRTSHYQKITVVKPLAQVSIPPQANTVITYEKAAMTHHVYVYDEPPEAPLARQASSVGAGAAAASATPAKPPVAPVRRTEVDRTVPFACPPRPGVPLSPRSTERWEQVENTARLLSESPAFFDFINKTTFVAEKCLQPGHRDISLEEAIGVTSSSSVKTDLLGVRARLSDPNVVRNVTSLCMQPGGSEFCAASYSDGNAFSTQGLVHVWSIRSTQTPAFTFHCDADIATIAFCATQPQVLIGGSYSGRLFKWDMRAGSEPVSASFPRSDCHNAPITSVQVAAQASKGTDDEIVSASADGRICVWPAESVVVPKAVGEFSGVVPNCLAVPNNKEASNVYYVGAADGRLYQTTKQGLSRNEQTAFSGSHSAAITGIDCHPASTNQTVSDTLLTSSLDWTCRLWARSTSQDRGGPAWQSLQVQCTDFVYDAKWCPTNAAVFACGDGGGNVILYNAAKSLDFAAATLQVAPGSSVSKLCWDATGHVLAAGCSNGAIVLCSVSPKVNKSADTDMSAFVQLFA